MAAHIFVQKPLQVMKVARTVKRFLRTGLSTALLSTVNCLLKIMEHIRFLLIAQEDHAYDKADGGDDDGVV